MSKSVKKPPMVEWKNYHRGLFVARNYCHISEYENEILEMWNNGQSLREIGNHLGFFHKEMKNVKTRYIKKQRLIADGEALHKKGRACKKEGKLPPSIDKSEKPAQMRYILVSKERYIQHVRSLLKT